MEGVSSITAFMGLRVLKTPRISRPPWAVVSAPRAEGSRSAAPVSSQKNATVIIPTINNYTQRSRSLKTPMIRPLPNYTIPTPPTVLSSPKESSGSRNPPREGHGTPACTRRQFPSPAQGEPPAPPSRAGAGPPGPWASAPSQQLPSLHSRGSTPRADSPHPRTERPPEKTHVCP